MTMREILFRGKAECDNKWYIGWYIPPYEYKWSGQDDTGRSKAVIEFVRDDLRPDFVPVKEATVGQYTGLTDKNGAKIFEGDIVKFSLITVCTLVPQGLRQVTFNGGSFMIEDPYSGDDETISRIAASVELEVVGNIHDNPDMIEGYIQSIRHELMEDK